MRFLIFILEVYPHGQVLVLPVFPELSFLLPCIISPLTRVPTQRVGNVATIVEYRVGSSYKTCSTSNAKWIHFSKPTYMYNISHVSIYTSNLNIWIHVTVTCWKTLVATKSTNCPISLTTTQFDGIPLVSKSLAILPYPSGRIKDTKGAAKCVLHLWSVLQVWSQNLSPALASLI